MAFLTKGLEDLRTHIMNEWDKIEILDNTDTRLCVLDVPNTNVTWTDDAVSNPLTLEVKIKGDGTTHSSIKVGTTIKTVRLFKSTDTSYTNPLVEGYIRDSSNQISFETIGDTRDIITMYLDINIV